MKKFIEEAKSLTRAMELLPDRASYKKRIDSLEDVYSRIPEPPPIYKSHHKAARQIAADFGVGELHLMLKDDALRADNEAGAKQSIRELRDLGAKLRADIDELERAMKDERIPKIKISDVISGKKK
jgi:hypothetical protein